jgi:hypothetical protein
MRKLVLTFILFISLLEVSAQTYPPFEQLKRYTKAQRPSRYDSTLLQLTNIQGAGLHYLYPFYQALGWEKRFKYLLGEKKYYTDLAQYLSFAGDYTMAITYITKSFDSLPTAITRGIQDSMARLKNIQFLPARQVIFDVADFYRVIMINEDYAKPVHRAFTYSLLEDLYKKGYRYLAMEALNNLSNKCLDSVNVFTGFYINEPVAGELVRKALRLGYTLISYEDTLAYKHTASERDSIQAANILEVLQSDTAAKVLIHAGYDHIWQERKGNYVPMAAWFTKGGAPDPFTVDQTGMTEGSEGEYGRHIYSNFISRFKITEPSVILENKRPFLAFDETGYDMVITHPPTVLSNNRPTWLGLNGERKPVLIQPTQKTLFMVQAYYENEYNEEYVSLLVPADQTYITNKEGYYCLFLRPGKYRIVLRDISYKILAANERVVE